MERDKGIEWRRPAQGKPKWSGGIIERDLSLLIGRERQRKRLPCLSLANMIIRALSKQAAHRW